MTSFTLPKAIPALRDAEEVTQRIRRNPDVVYTVLVPNVRGAERAKACKVDEINLVMIFLDCLRFGAWIKRVAQAISNKIEACHR